MGTGMKTGRFESDTNSPFGVGHTSLYPRMHIATGTSINPISEAMKLALNCSQHDGALSTCVRLPPR